MLIILSAFICPSAVAQDASRPVQAPGVVDFAATPYRIESLGMSMWLPVGTQIDSSNILGGDINFQISAPDNLWLMRGFSPESRDVNLTPAAVVKSLEKSLLRPERITNEMQKEWNVNISGVNGKLLDETADLLLDNKPSARFYASMIRQDKIEIVIGYTVQQLGPGRFMLYEFTCLIDEYQKARPQYETILAATTFEDPNEAAQLRATGVNNANSILTALTSDDLDSLIAESDQYTFYRLYRPATTGSDMDATEIAYQRIRMAKGQRGEVDPSKSKRNWGVLERQPGYIVQVDGRFLDGSDVIESQGIFFLSRDQNEELWTIRTQIRDSINRIQSWDELGVRKDNDIKVTITQPGSPATLTQWKIPQEAYCSQVISYLLPKLYVSRGAPQVFNVYRFNSSSGELSLRSDSLERSKTGAGWVLRTKQHENAQEETSALNDNGQLTRRILSSGIMMEPVELKKLIALWERKGLPLD
jgi:hypothetical protein